MSLKQVGITLVVALVVVTIVAALALRTPARDPARDPATAADATPTSVMPPLSGDDNTDEVLATIEQGDTPRERDLLRLQTVVQAPVFADAICPTAEAEQARTLCELAYGRTHVHAKTADQRSDPQDRGLGRGLGRGQGKSKIRGDRRGGPPQGDPPPPQGAAEP